MLRPITPLVLYMLAVWQALGGGGGVYVHMGGQATLTNTNVYTNDAYTVRSLFEPSRTFLPAPHWNVTCAHGQQNGGGLFISGTATLTDTNVYDNRARVRFPANRTHV